MSRIAETKPQRVKTVLSSEETTILSLIERVASDLTIDLDRVEKFLDMHAKIKDESSRKAYNDAMSLAQSEMPQVLRTARNSQTNSNYATLESIDEAMKPVITKHGFSLSFEPRQSQQEGHIGIKCLVAHRDGYERWYDADIPIDSAGLKGTVNKTRTHAFGSTMSYGRRYLKMMIFDIATTDNDGNQEPVDTISQEQADNIRGLILSTGANEMRFLNYTKCRALEDIPAASYDNAIAALNNAQKKREGSA